MVGGFYVYDNHTEIKDLGSLCSGKSDDHGIVSCDVKLKDAGNVDLIAVAKDGDGHAANASTSVWVTREDELCFGGENTDCIDVLPEKTSYEAGETARFQVHMPFRSATALVAVEREGIVEMHVVELNGRDPTVELKVRDAWEPNVYVSVLALRGRIHEVPWYSFFTWAEKHRSNERVRLVRRLSVSDAHAARRSVETRVPIRAGVDQGRHGIAQAGGQRDAGRQVVHRALEGAREGQDRAARRQVRARGHADRRRRRR